VAVLATASSMVSQTWSHPVFVTFQQSVLATTDCCCVWRSRSISVTVNGNQHQQEVPSVCIIMIQLTAPCAVSCLCPHMPCAMPTYDTLFGNSCITMAAVPVQCCTTASEAFWLLVGVGGGPPRGITYLRQYASYSMMH